MRFIGHGIDIVDVAKFLPSDPEEEALFAARCFTVDELAAAGSGPHRMARLAGRFAAKEAVLKALGTGQGDGVAFTDVELRLGAMGAPQIVLTGRALEVATALSITQWVVSISHTTSVAVASVIAAGE